MVHSALDVGAKTGLAGLRSVRPGAASPLGLQIKVAMGSCGSGLGTVRQAVTTPSVS